MTLTTNGSQLARFARELVDCGVKRINVSLDTLDPDKFRQATRWGDLGAVLAGVNAASAAGLKIKINAVALKGFNEEEALSLVEWAHGRGFDMTFIEVMPLGAMERDRADQFLPLTQLRARLESSLSMTPSSYATGGPARYYNVKETGGRIGLPIISARIATASASRAPERSICASARRTRPICASRCAAQPRMRRFFRPSGRRSRASPRATISPSRDRRRRRLSVI